MHPRLDLDNLPIYGRDNELTALHEAVERVHQLGVPEVVFLVGGSGNGKTRLGNVLNTEQQEENCFYVAGQFDKFVHRPYSAFIDALSDLCEKVGSSKNADEYKLSLLESLGDEETILRDALPKVEKILGPQTVRCGPLYNENFSVDRLKISFRALLRAVTSTGKMLIMFIDDLHWGDTESWNLMKYLASDAEMKHLLLIAAYRDDEMSALASQNVTSLSQSCQFQSLKLTEFDVEKLNGLLALILKTTPIRTKELAHILHAKSAGNPCFAIQLLRTIEKQHLISYSLEHCCWEWQTEKIQSDTDIGDNIVGIYVAKIERLEENARIALIVASCLGAKFDSLVVELVLGDSSLRGTTLTLSSREQLTATMETALKDGIIDRQSGSTIYRFAHDTIHSALYSRVIEIAEPDQLHLKIGQILLEHWKVTQPCQDWLTFLAVNQLNQGVRLVGHAADRMELAHLNLMAAKAAMSASAYRPASEYLHQGLYLIEDFGWEQYDLRLELSILLSKTDFCIGDFESCHKAVDEVIRNARTAEEKIPVFRVRVDALGAEGRMEECFDQGMAFAKQLGVKLPKKCNKLTSILGLVKTKKMLRGKTEADLLNYARAVDPSKLAAVRIINTLSLFAVHARSNDLMATLVFINTQLILKHGFTDEAGSLLAYYGYLLAWTGDFDEGYKYGQIGVKLANKTNHGVPRTFMIHYTGLNHLKNPLHQGLEPFLRGYRVAFEGGDTLYGLYCSFQYLTIFYFASLPLDNLLRDMEAFGKEMEAYNARPPLLLLKPYHQAVINLTSETPNPTLLDGAAMTEAELSGCGLPQALEGVWLAKLLLALYFDDFEVMRVNLNKLLYDRPRGVDGCMFYAIVVLWAEGFAAMQMARRTKQRKYKAIAWKRIKKMETWMKKGNMNCHHFLLHLHAERSAWENKPWTEVKRAYDAAISTSRRAGFTNTAAIASERCALYFLKNQDRERAAMYMISACELYDGWGARAKKTLLIKEHGRMMRTSQNAESFISGALQTHASSTSMRGRERHTSVVRDLHRGASLELIDLNSSRNGFSDAGGSGSFSTRGRRHSSSLELGGLELEQSQHDFRRSRRSSDSLVATLAEAVERENEIPASNNETSISDINALLQKVDIL